MQLLAPWQEISFFAARSLVAVPPELFWRVTLGLLEASPQSLACPMLVLPDGGKGAEEFHDAAHEAGLSASQTVAMLNCPTLLKWPPHTGRQDARRGHIPSFLAVAVWLKIPTVLAQGHGGMCSAGALASRCSPAHSVGYSDQSAASNEAPGCKPDECLEGTSLISL